MNWIIASLLMFVSSVILYTMVRKATLHHIPAEYINFFSFAVAIVLYLIVVIQKNISLILPWQLIIFLLGLALIGSFIPNTASLKSIKYAPNPGYSLIISKSYVVFTTIFAVIFLKAHLSIKSIIAITVIILFSILIMVGKSNTHKHSSPLWLPLAFVSFFGWGLLWIGTKYAFQMGINIYERLIYLAVFVSIFSLIEIGVKKTKTQGISTKGYILLICIGIASTLFNYFTTLAIDLAPNIGYVNAINASSISAVTVVAALLFKDDFSFKKVIGVVGVTCGLLLLIL